MSARPLRAAVAGLTVATIVFGFGAASAAAASAPSMTLDQYRSALSRTRSEAVAAMQEKIRSAHWAVAARARIRAALPLQVVVSLPSGEVHVDNRPLGETLAQALGEPRPAARRASLRRFIAAVDQLLAVTGATTPGTDRSRAGRVLREVLSRPEYQSREADTSWFDEFLSWLDRLLSGLAPRSSTPGVAPGRGLGRILVAIVVLLLGALIARIILTVLPDLRAPRRREVDEPGGELLLPQEPEALLAEAEREAAAGRYREALRLTYRAMVARLERAGILPDDRSRTHWELLRDLRRLTASGSAPHSLTPSLPRSLIPILAPLTRRLDERLYGGRPATAEDYQDCRRAHDQVERLLCAPA